MNKPFIIDEGKTLQELFNTVVEHLRKQERAALSNNEGGCVYLAENGDKCAVGCLFPEDVARKADNLTSLAGTGVQNLALEGIISCEKKESLDLLDRLQQAHDGAINLDDLNYMLKEVAKKFNLTFETPLTKWKPW